MTIDETKRDTVHGRERMPSHAHSEQTPEAAHDGPEFFVRLDTTDMQDREQGKRRSAYFD